MVCSEFDEDCFAESRAFSGAPITLYHGSIVSVESPKIFESNRMLDFGTGFYTISNREQALRWAEIVSVKRKTQSRVITEYEFDINSAKKHLEVVTFSEPDEQWLEFVCLNRSGRKPLLSYDIAIGPVADDQVFAVVTLYEHGVLSKEAAILELKVREVYNQVLFHTEKSLNYCRYLRHTVIGKEGA